MQRLDQPAPGARAARPRPLLGLRLPHRAGQRPGRARARAEGRPAARLPQARRTRRPRARRRGVGRRPRRAARARAVGATSCSTRSAPTAACARCWSCGVQPGGVRARRAATSRSGCARWTSSPSPTSCCPRPPQLADVVLPTTQWAEESGTMTNLEGRVLLRRKAVDAAAGGAHRPARCCAGSPTGSAGAAVFPTEPEEVFDELRRASAGGIGRLRGHHLRAARRGATASSGRARPRTTPARRACSSTASPRPTAAPGSSPSAPRRPPRCPTRTTRTCSPPGGSSRSTSRARRPGAVPTLAAAVPRPYVELHPELAARLGVAEGDPVRLSTRARRAPSLAPGSTTASGRDTVFMPFHWGGAAAPTR